MRAAAKSLSFVALAAGLVACGGMEEATDDPACGGGFEAETHGRYRGEPGKECTLRGAFSGVRVELPAIPADRAWVLEGTVGGEPFLCSVTPGMVEGDPCSENAQVGWAGSVVRLAAHPCELSVRLAVEGEPIAEARMAPAYEWIEPNGPGCGWAGVANVVLTPHDA